MISRRGWTLRSGGDRLDSVGLFSSSQRVTKFLRPYHLGRKLNLLDSLQLSYIIHSLGERRITTRIAEGNVVCEEIVEPFQISHNHQEPVGFRPKVASTLEVDHGKWLASGEPSPWDLITPKTAPTIFYMLFQVDTYNFPVTRNCSVSRLRSCQKEMGRMLAQLYMTVGSKILAVPFLSTVNIVLGSLILTRSRNSISPLIKSLCLSTDFSRPKPISLGLDPPICFTKLSLNLTSKDWRCRGAGRSSFYRDIEDGCRDSEI